jgi:hypothetical protein
MSSRRLKNATETMTLSFPNQSRFYDATRGAVRFWGHDSAMEASFFVNADALKRIKPDTRSDETGLLGVFDSNRKLIYAIAAEVYERGRRGSYDLVAADFRI